MRLRKSKVKAFTLLECLVALLVISGSLLVFDGLSRSLSREIAYQQQNLTKDWLVFAEQLRQELDQSSFVKVADNRLYVKKAGQELAFGKSKADDFRKTNWSGQGYQPMIQRVKTAAVKQEQQRIRIDLTFETGMERSFIYEMAKSR